MARPLTGGVCAAPVQLRKCFVVGHRTVGWGALDYETGLVVITDAAVFPPELPLRC